MEELASAGNYRSSLDVGLVNLKLVLVKDLNVGLGTSDQPLEAIAVSRHRHLTERMSQLFTLAERAKKGGIEIKQANVADLVDLLRELVSGS